MNAMLSQNIGNYVVVTFLVGTQGLVNWEGILYEVGNNYLTIYQESRDRYIVADIYSVKFVEFYDTQRRKLCDSLIQQNWQESQAEKDHCAGAGDVVKSAYPHKRKEDPNGFCNVVRRALLSAEIQ